MINTTSLKIDGKTAVGVKVDLPDSALLLLVIGETEFVTCGFLNIDAAEKLNVAAATVSGVKNSDDILNAEVKAVTSKAKNRRVRVGMKGKETLKLLL